MAGEQEPEIKIKDRKLVEIVYPSGRVVRYLYNGILSELQPPLLPPPTPFIVPPREPED